MPGQHLKVAMSPLPGQRADPCRAGPGLRGRACGDRGTASEGALRAEVCAGPACQLPKPKHVCSCWQPQPHYSHRLPHAAPAQGSSPGAGPRLSVSPAQLQQSRHSASTGAQQPPANHSPGRPLTDENTEAQKVPADLRPLPVSPGFLLPLAVCMAHRCHRPPQAPGK